MCFEMNDRISVAEELIALYLYKAFFLFCFCLRSFQPKDGIKHHIKKLLQKGCYSYFFQK